MALNAGNTVNQNDNKNYFKIQCLSHWFKSTRCFGAVRIIVIVIIKPYWCGVLWVVTVCEGAHAGTEEAW